jgi:phosphoserine phosphatase
VVRLAHRLQQAWEDPRGLGAPIADAGVLERSAKKLGPIASFAAMHARMSKLLGSPVRGGAAGQAINFDAGVRERVKSDELIRAMEQIDVGELRARGIPATAVFDFDDTLMHGDVIVEFAELAVASKFFAQESNPRVVDRMLEHLPPERDPATARAGLLARDVHENVKLALKLIRAEKMPSHGLFYVLAAALEGQTVEKVTELARELFVAGAPGRAPYRTHLLSRGTEKSSAKDLVDTLSSRDIDCWIVTAGFAAIARVGAEYAGIPADRVIGSELLVDDRGKITGEAIDMVEVGKDRALLEKIGAPPLFAFGDNPRTDGPMLRLATVKGVIVGDQPAFRRLNDQHSLGHLELSFN